MQVQAADGPSDGRSPTGTTTIMGMIEDLLSLVSPFGGEILLRFTNGTHNMTAGAAVMALGECLALLGFCFAGCT